MVPNHTDEIGRILCNGSRNTLPSNRVDIPSRPHFTGIAQSFPVGTFLQKWHFCSTANGCFEYRRRVDPHAEHSLFPSFIVSK
jgi:hypothetical protein